jgi:hypothetical protein
MCWLMLPLCDEANCEILFLQFWHMANYFYPNAAECDAFAHIFSLHWPVCLQKLCINWVEGWQAVPSMNSVFDIWSPHTA